MEFHCTEKDAQGAMESHWHHPTPFSFENVCACPSKSGTHPGGWFPFGFAFNPSQRCTTCLLLQFAVVGSCRLCASSNVASCVQRRRPAEKLGRNQFGGCAFVGLCRGSSQWEKPHTWSLHDPSKTLFWVLTPFFRGHGDSRQTWRRLAKSRTRGEHDGCSPAVCALDAIRAMFSPSQH